MSGFGSSWGSFGGTSATPAHHSSGNILSNLLSDIRDAAVGLPEGIVQLAEHPIRSTEAIGKSTWKDWSPLFHGNVGEWAHNFAAHPLAPILDVAGLVTGGAGLAGKLSKLSTLGEVSAATKAAEIAGKSTALRDLNLSTMAKFGRGEAHTQVIQLPGAPAAAREFSSNPAVRLRQQAAHNLSHSLSEHLPKWFGDQGASIRDLTDTGHASRYAKRQQVYYQHAATAAGHLQMAQLVKGGKFIVESPQEAGRLVYSHGLDDFIHHASPVAEKDLLEGNKVSDGYTFIKADTKSPTINSVEDYENALKHFGPNNTTRNAAKALRDERGNYLVVHNHAAARWSEEAVRSSKAMRILYSKPLRAWKWMILATRPGFFVNNAVGNVAMHLMTHGPGGFRGFVDAVRNTHGDSYTERMIREGSSSLPKDDAVARNYGGLYKQGFASETAAGQKIQHISVAGHELPDKAVKAVNVAGRGLYPVTHKYTDELLRNLSARAFLHKSDEVKALRSNGHSFDSAVDKASSDPLFRHRIQEQVNNSMGQYHYFNPTEKAVRQLVPFYSWDRHIMRHGVHLALDEPAKAAVAAGVGESGTKKTEQILGDIPDFLRGLIPLGGHGANGRKNVLSTSGLNPYATLPDVADTLGALVGAGNAQPGEALASQLNPLITGLIESATGQSLLSGAKLPHRPGGVIGQTVSNVTEGLPLVKLIETALGGESQPHANKSTGKTTPFLYRKDLVTQLLANLGAPVKELDTTQAHALAAKRSGLKKRRKALGFYG